MNSSSHLNVTGTNRSVGTSLTRMFQPATTIGARGIAASAMAKESLADGPLPLQAEAWPVGRR